MCSHHLLIDIRGLVLSRGRNDIAKEIDKWVFPKM
jgi:hypothetical protein